MRKHLLYGAIVFVVVILLFTLLPSVYSNEDLFFQAMVYLALAQGVNILYGFTGYLPFGYVGFFGTGAYATALSITLLHIPPIPAILIGGLASVVLGILLSPLLRLSGAYFAIGSLAASQMVYYIVSNPALQNLTNGPYGINLESVYQPRASYITMIVIVALVMGVVIYIRNSRFGLALQAIREDPVSAGMAGIHVVRQRAMAWFLSAMIAGVVGGAFAWHISVFYPTTVFDLNISIFAIVFTLFGGVTTVLGPVLGMFVLYGFYNVIGISEPQYFQLIYGVLILVLVLFLPSGMVSLMKRRGHYVP